MKRVTIFKNGCASDGKLIALPATIEDLLDVASDKLNMKSVRVFASTGGEVDDINLIRDDDVLYISRGETFFGGSSASASNWVSLNVGGKHFTTSKSNITDKEPQCMLARMLAEDENGYLMNPSARDYSGAFLIDRSPVYFEHILNYLRNGEISLSSGEDFKAILEEARFYGVESLVTQLEWHLGKDEPTDLGKVMDRIHSNR